MYLFTYIDHWSFTYFDPKFTTYIYLQWNHVTYFFWANIHFVSWILWLCLFQNLLISQFLRLFLWEVLITGYCACPAGAMMKCWELEAIEMFCNCIRFVLVYVSIALNLFKLREWSNCLGKNIFFGWNDGLGIIHLSNDKSVTGDFAVNIGHYLWDEQLPSWTKGIIFYTIKQGSQNEPVSIS